jgi:hypothetical protein
MSRLAYVSRPGDKIATYLLRRSAIGGFAPDAWALKGCEKTEV